MRMRLGAAQQGRESWAYVRNLVPRQQQRAKPYSGAEAGEESIHFPEGKGPIPTGP